MGRPATRAELAKAIAPLATKKELAKAIAALATKEDLAKAIAPLATKEQLDEVKVELHGAIAMVMKYMDARFAQQSVELARHVNAVIEEMRTMVKAVDEKYADLPGRVSRLEAERGSSY